LGWAADDCSCAQFGADERGAGSSAFSYVVSASVTRQPWLVYAYLLETPRRYLPSSEIGPDKVSCKP